MEWIGWNRMGRTDVGDSVNHGHRSRLWSVACRWRTLVDVHLPFSANDCACILPHFERPNGIEGAKISFIVHCGVQFDGPFVRDCPLMRRGPWPDQSSSGISGWKCWKVATVASCAGVHALIISSKLASKSGNEKGKVIGAEKAKQKAKREPGIK